MIRAHRHVGLGDDQQQSGILPALIVAVPLQARDGRLPSDSAIGPGVALAARSGPGWPRRRRQAISKRLAGQVHIEAVGRRSDGDAIGFARAAREMQVLDFEDVIAIVGGGEIDFLIGRRRHRRIALGDFGAGLAVAQNHVNQRRRIIFERLGFDGELLPLLRGEEVEIDVVAFLETSGDGAGDGDAIGFRDAIVRLLLDGFIEIAQDQRHRPTVQARRLFGATQIDVERRIARHIDVNRQRRRPPRGRRIRSSPSRRA